MRKNSMFALGEQHILDCTKDAALYVLGRMNEMKQQEISIDQMDVSSSGSESRGTSRIRVLGARMQHDDYALPQEINASSSDFGISSFDEVSHISSTSGVSFVLVVAAVLALIVLVAVVTVGILHFIGQL